MASEKLLSLRNVKKKKARGSKEKNSLDILQTPITFFTSKNFSEKLATPENHREIYEQKPEWFNKKFPNKPIIRSKMFFFFVGESLDFFFSSYSPIHHREFAGVKATTTTTTLAPRHERLVGLEPTDSPETSVNGLGATTTAILSTVVKSTATSLLLGKNVIVSSSKSRNELVGGESKNSQKSNHRVSFF